MPRHMRGARISFKPRLFHATGYGHLQMKMSQMIFSLVSLKHWSYEARVGTTPVLATYGEELSTPTLTPQRPPPGGRWRRCVLPPQPFGSLLLPHYALAEGDYRPPTIMAVEHFWYHAPNDTAFSSIMLAIF